MEYTPKLVTTINNIEYFEIPFNPEITGYAISKCGKTISNKTGNWKTLITPLCNNTGYYILNLTTNTDNSKSKWRKRSQKTFTLHRVLYSTFVSGINHPRNMVVDHIDNDKNNNNIDNLQLLTFEDNIKKFDITKSKRKMVLTAEQVEDVWNRVQKGEKRKDIIKATGVKSKFISSIVTGHSWNSITSLPKKQVGTYKPREKKASKFRIEQYAKQFERQIMKESKKEELKRLRQQYIVEAETTRIESLQTNIKNYYSGISLPEAKRIISKYCDITLSEALKIIDKAIKENSIIYYEITGTSTKKYNKESVLQLVKKEEVA